MNVPPLARAGVAGFVAFLAGVVLVGGCLGAAGPEDWDQAVAVAVAMLGAAAIAAAAGWVGARQALKAGLRGGASLAGAVLGPAAGALLLWAGRPQPSLAALAGLLAVLAGATAAAFASLARPRRRAVR